MVQAVLFKRSDTRSKVIADAMAEGIRSCGDSASVVYTHQYQRRPSGDVAIFYGFKGEGREIFHDYLAEGRHVIFVDLGYFCRRHGGRYYGYHRIAFDARHASNTVMMGEQQPDRLNHLRSLPDSYACTDLRLKPWQSGEYIVVAGMQKKAARSYKVQYMEWEVNAVKEIRKHSDREIIYRPKPKDDDARPIDGCGYSDRSQKLAALLRHAHAVVTHHSNVAVEAIIEGIPIFCADGIAAPMGLADLSRIESPYYPNEDARDKWLRAVPYWQWNVREMQIGQPWRFVKQMGLFG